VASLAKRYAAACPEDLISACLAEMQSFSGGARQKDDLTLLALRRVN
jgi:serine phosphatase RsbU (regulator of sigma subunit)